MLHAIFVYFWLMCLPIDEERIPNESLEASQEFVEDINIHLKSDYLKSFSKKIQKIRLRKNLDKLTDMMREQR